MSRDWLYRRPGSFGQYRCGACASLYPDPRPDAATLPAYYPEDEYYAYREPARHRLFQRRGPAARAWYALRRGVLRCHYGYEALGGSRLLAGTLGRVPAIRERAAFSLGPLLHPWRRDGALLDVGCGAGMYLDLMRALGWSRTVGVDVSPRAVRQARDVLGLEAYAGDLRAVRLPGAAFDVVSLSHTLEHVDDPVAVLAEIRRVVRPGGRVVIEVPNVRSLTARILRGHWLGIDTPRHLINFSPRGLETAVRAAGLQLESLTTPCGGAYRVALFSLSRARGDEHGTYTDAEHRFSVRRRVAARALAALERSACAAGFRLGEEVRVVARR
jgi:SAM-dependent methyltransferase